MALLPSPADLGAPAKFDTWRNYQEDAIFQAQDSPTRFTMQVVPTGAGKSLIYTMLAHLTGERTAILTRTKALQEQLTADFASMGLSSVRGMNSYLCRAMEPGGELHGVFNDAARRSSTIGCDEGPCRVGAACTLKSGGCDYYDALDTGLQSSLMVTNYTYWMHQHRHGKGLGAFGLLILDEAHDAPDALSEFLTVELLPWQLDKVGAKVMEGEPTPAQWKDWGRYHHARVSQRAEVLQQGIKERREANLSVSKAVQDEARDWKQIAGVLEVVSRVDDRWVCYQQEKRWVFAPAWPAPYAESSLFLNIKRVILTSATVREKTAVYLGIPATDLTVQEYPSVFPLASRPIYHIPTTRVRHGMSSGEAAIWQSRIDGILRMRPGLKGIIHTVSYARAKAIYDASEHRDRLLIHSAAGTRIAIASFKGATADSGKVLISPSVTTGYDFPYDQCRFQIISKLPFPDQRDPVLQARTATDAEYGMYQMIQTLVQASGRGMRADDDFCETFIIDDYIRWVLAKYRHLAPKWFLDAVKTRDLIPTAPASSPVRRRA